MMKLGDGRFSVASKVSKSLVFLKAPSRLTIAGHLLALRWDYIRHKSPVFVELRRDCGDMQKNGVVVDIGANIVIFALFAALSGGNRVYEFMSPLMSPLKAIEILSENIAVNGRQRTLSHHIFADRFRTVFARIALPVC